MDSKVALFLLFIGAGDIPAVGRDQEKRVLKFS